MQRFLTSLLLCGIVAVAIAAPRTADAQIVSYHDSAAFDDDHGRLRDIDFEDLFAVTVDHMTVRNPYGLHTLAMYDSLFEPTDDILLELSQGGTIHFPTRTRTVIVEGFANPFYVEVRTFTDSVYMIDLTEFPVTISDDAGIERLQFLGTEGWDTTLDVNWHATLWTTTALNTDGDTVAHSNFDELIGDRFYYRGIGYDMNDWVEQPELFAPMEIHGVTFHEPYWGMLPFHLSSFEARVDPDNPIGNLGFEFTDEGVIEFATGTEGALLVMEKIMIADTFLFEATDFAGDIDTVMVVGAGREYDTTWVEDQRTTYGHVAFSSPDGLKSIRPIAAWTMGPGEVIDTVIDGVPTTVVLQEPYPILTAISAVHVAEAPPLEIGGVRSAVDDVDRDGYLDENTSDGLRNYLTNAETYATAGERSLALEHVVAFRAEVSDLYAQGALVAEEFVRFDDDATYLITRLGTSGVTGEESHASDLSVTSIVTDGASMTVTVDAPNGSTLELVITDLRGRVVRRLAGAGSTIVWDLADAQGNGIASGAYLVTLRSGDSAVTEKVVVMRGE